ncbi:hypothetical protein, conserved [Eimeria acervulina]|uniref:Uncharacterized protein n=1 Tax=Eimeria acervulina TaxID=5801 RepID=U6GZ85_EIMAC|nr:hypothetical protein, conserved [Eimeria acervulina]CDI83849.1 hypothetical protein, conserved [Eimeria acervulina]
MLRAAEQLQDVPPRQQQEAVDEETALEAAEVLMASAQGVAIAEMLDELAKEQRRMEEVQRISALANLAVRERRLREAQESGTRQAEEMLRERENRLFQNAMGINNQTIDSYLQAIIEKAGAGNAQEEALLEVCLHSEHLARVVDDLQEGQEEPHVIVGELVRGLLMPTLASQCQRRDKQIEDHKFRVAARLAVEETVVGALSNRVLKLERAADAGGKTC